MKHEHVLAIDPGNVHVGVAVWDVGDIKAMEFEAVAWLKLFDVIVQRVDLVIVEDFRLYPGQASAQSYSRMKTPKMIGAMEWLAGCAGVPIELQSANIKIPTRQQCKARGINTKHKSPHASDALLHLHYYLIRNDLEV